VSHCHTHYIYAVYIYQRRRARNRFSQSTSDDDDVNAQRVKRNTRVQQYYNNNVGIIIMREKRVLGPRRYILCATSLAAEIRRASTGGGDVDEKT